MSQKEQYKLHLIKLASIAIEAFKVQVREHMERELEQAVKSKQDGQSQRKIQKIIHFQNQPEKTLEKESQIMTNT